MGSRPRSPALIVATIAMACACQFDPSGRWASDDQPAGDGGATGAPDADPGMIDAAPSPIDSAPIDDIEIVCGAGTCSNGDICCMSWDPFGQDSCMPADACDSAEVSCDGPEDCDDGVCCTYGGFGSSCSDTCIGGDRLCQDAADCTEPGAGICCESNNGPDVCQAFCF